MIIRTMLYTPQEMKQVRLPFSPSLFPPHLLLAFPDGLQKGLHAADLAPATVLALSCWP